MLTLPELRLCQPRELSEAIALLAEPGSRALAGGTDLLVAALHRRWRGRLVAISRLPELQGLSEEPDGGLRIGAATRLLALRQDARVQACWPALAESIRQLATRNIQAMGTIGGNVLLDARCRYVNQSALWRASLGGCRKSEGSACFVAPGQPGCVAASAADTVPALWLYGAELELVGPDGARRMPLSALYAVSDGRQPQAISPGELLVALRLPPPAAPVVHWKFRPRQSIDFASMLFALRREGEGARAVVSTIGPAPIELWAERAEELPELAWEQVLPTPTQPERVVWRRDLLRAGLLRALAGSA
jgi:4-hydroxybenzoyl-CoA reductase subunit beta